MFRGFTLRPQGCTWRRDESREVYWASQQRPREHSMRKLDAIAGYDLAGCLLWCDWARKRVDAVFKSLASVAARVCPRGALLELGLTSQRGGEPLTSCQMADEPPRPADGAVLRLPRGCSGARKTPEAAAMRVAECRVQSRGRAPGRQGQRPCAWPSAESGETLVRGGGGRSAGTPDPRVGANGRQAAAGQRIAGGAGARGPRHSGLGGRWAGAKVSATDRPGCRPRVAPEAWRRRARGAAPRTPSASRSWAQTHGQLRHRRQNRGLRNRNSQCVP